MGIVVFTDLDGTLLDHDTYSHAAAAPALAELKRRHIPLVLASSKTAAEIGPLHAELDLGDTPAIVENGAGIFDPSLPTQTEDEAYRATRNALSNLSPDLAGKFRGFGDMTAAEVAVATGLTEADAALARQRCFSEPGVWLGSDDELDRFLAALDAAGITVRRGGRFLTLSHGRTKADAVRDLARRLGAEVTIALGDAPNDAEMLQMADFGVLVRNDHAPPIPRLEAGAKGRILRTAKPGPQGWNEAVLGLLKEIDGT